MKQCKACAQAFAPARPMQAVCSPRCATRVVRAKKAAERASDKARREKIKTRAQWMAEAQAAFNAFVRARDAGLPCICCGGISAGWTRGGEWDAGHYRSRGAAPHLRFDERNVHAQLKQCNRRAWDVAAYRANLIERIGLAEVEALEADNRIRKFTIADLKSIRDEYRQKLRIRENGAVTSKEGGTSGGGGWWPWPRKLGQRLASYLPTWAGMLSPSALRTNSTSSTAISSSCFSWFTVRRLSAGLSPEVRTPKRSTKQRSDRPM